MLLDCITHLVIASTTRAMQYLQFAYLHPYATHVWTRPLQSALSTCQASLRPYSMLKDSALAMPIALGGNQSMSQAQDLHAGHVTRSWINAPSLGEQTHEAAADLAAQQADALPEGLQDIIKGLDTVW